MNGSYPLVNKHIAIYSGFSMMLVYQRYRLVETAFEAALTQLEEERAQGNFRRFGEKSSGQDGLNAEGFRSFS